MHLDDFHKSLDSGIYSRGEEYYMEGRVLELAEQEPGKWKGSLEGSQFYTVTVSLDEGELKRPRILEASCDCPYDWGAVCKHQVAVFLALGEQYQRRAFAAASGLPQNTTGVSTFKAWLTRHEEDFNKEDLLEFLGEYGKWNADFRKAFQEWVHQRGN